MENKKNILFVLPFLPYPLVSGGHQALLNGILAVKDEFNIYIVYHSILKGVYAEDVNGFHEKVPNAHLFPFVEKKKNNNFWHRVRIIGSKVLKTLFYGKVIKSDISAEWVNTYLPPSNPKWVKFVNDICAKVRFDIIQVEMPWMISQIFCLPEDCLRVHVHHELGFVMRQLQLQMLESKNLLTDYTFSNYKYANLNEISQLNLYDLIITLSSIDADKLIKQGVTKPVRSSFAVVDAIEQSNEDLCKEKVLSFVGSDSHLPNYRGIIWFLENCWVGLKSFDKDWHLKIVGKWSAGNIEVVKKKYKDVEFLGYVDDLNSVLSNTIMIVPILEGSGIRMKILEACSYGIPFVSTTVGAEGIPVINGESCFLADSPEEFVDAIIKMCSEDLQKKFIKNAYDMVVKNFSLCALRENRMRIYSEFL